MDFIPSTALYVNLIHHQILVAEDDLTNQLVIQQFVERLGGSATIVENGQLALDAVQSQTYDIVFMDCQMPVLDGFETTRRIRQRERQHAGQTELVIIALTANAMASDREECFAAGMTDFVTKPMNGKALRNILHRYLKIEQESAVINEQQTTNDL